SSGGLLTPSASNARLSSSKWRENGGLSRGRLNRSSSFLSIAPRVSDESPCSAKEMGSPLASCRLLSTLSSVLRLRLSGRASPDAAAPMRRIDNSVKGDALRGLRRAPGPVPSFFAPSGAFFGGSSCFAGLEREGSSRALLWEGFRLRG